MMLLLLFTLLLGVAADDQLVLLNKSIDHIAHLAGTTAVSCFNPTSFSTPSTISTGSSVIALYHNNIPIAWCNTIATLSINLPGIECSNARRSCQRCEAKLWLDGHQGPKDDYYAPGFHKRPPKDQDGYQKWKAGKTFPMYRFKNWCRLALTLNVRADCPYHDNFDGKDPPPENLVKPCEVDAPKEEEELTKEDEKVKGDSTREADNELDIKHEGKDDITSEEVE